MTPRRGMAPYVIAELLASRSLPVSADELLERVWSELPTPQGRHKVHQFISRLRKRYPGAVLTVADAYLLNEDDVEVDAWAFDDALETKDARRLVPLLDAWSSEPLYGLDAPSPRVQLFGQSLAARRVWAAELIARLLPIEDLGTHLELVERELDRAPLNPLLAVAVAAALQSKERVPDALKVVARLRDQLLVEKGLSPSETLMHAELSLLQGRPIEVAADRKQRVDNKGRHGPAGPLTPTAEAFVGRRRAAEALYAFVESGSAGAALLEGEPGIGKSELLLHLAQAMTTSGYLVRRSVAASGSAEPFGLLAEALPEFVDIDFAMGTEFSTIVGWRQMRDVLQLLGRENSRTVLLLDDVHSADSASLGFLRYLFETGVPERVSVIAAARPPDHLTTDAWLSTRRSLTGSSALDPIVLNPLEASDVVELLEQRFPGNTRSEYLRAATRIHRHTEGVPLDISTFLHGRDSLPDTDVGFEIASSERFVARVGSARVIHLLGLAATIGVRFEVEQLALIAQRPIGEVLEAIQDAMYQDVVRELGDGSFRFVHSVAASGFASSIPLVARQMVHAKLALIPQLSAGDLSRHVRNAGPMIEHDDGYRVTFRAAQTLMEARLLDEAALALVEAERRAVGDDQLADVLILAATVATHVGTQDDALLAWNRAMQVIDPLDHERLKRLALSGLPDGESPYPEPARRHLLDQLAEAELEREDFDALFHRMHVRITWMCDDLPAARKLLRRIDERRERLTGMSSLDAALDYEALVLDSMSPKRWVTSSQLKRQYVQLQDPRLRAGLMYRQAWESLQELEPGFDELITKAIEQSREAGAGKTEYLAELLRATVAGSRVSVADHRESTPPQRAFAELIAHAQRVGVQLGIRGTDAGYSAGFFQMYWFSGRLCEVAEMLLNRPIVGEDVLASAGAAVTLSFDPTRRHETEQMLSLVENGLKKNPDSITSPDSACLAIDAAVRSGATADLGPALAVLEDRPGEGLVGGLGTVYLGPVDRYRALALRARGEDETRVIQRLLHGAAEQMHMIGMTYWEERCRQSLKKK